MALGQLEAVEQLRQELIGGQELSARLQELLSHPLDSGGREAALEMIKQISRVFMVAQFILKPGDSSIVWEARMVAPDVTTGRSIGRRSLTEDKRICGSEEVTPPRNGREEEIAASPHKDSCLWRKYGQKNIQKRIFPRYYYKCMFSHDHGCRAKKRVQRQDSSSDEGRPMFQVTYVNEHTCHGVLLPDENTFTATNTPTRNAGYAGSFAPPNHVSGNAEFDNDTMVSCLAMVIGGAAAPSSSSSSSFLPPPAHVQARMSTDPASWYVLDGGHSSPSLLDFGMGLDDEMATEETSFFSCGSPFPFTPIVEEAAPAPLLPSPPVEAVSSDPAPAAYVPAGAGQYWPSLNEMAGMNFACGPVFLVVNNIGSWTTQMHHEQPDFPSAQPPAASSSSFFSSQAWPFFDVDDRWG